MDDFIDQFLNDASNLEFLQSIDRDADRVTSVAMQGEGAVVDDNYKLDSFVDEPSVPPVPLIPPIMRRYRSLAKCAFKPVPLTKTSTFLFKAKKMKEEEENGGRASPAAPPDSVVRLLQKLQSSGAAVLKRQPQKAAHSCRKCKRDYPTYTALLEHIVCHVALPDIILERVPSDDEEEEEDEGDWSDAPVESDEDVKSNALKREPKDILKLLNTELGISIRKAPSAIAKVDDSNKRNEATEDVASNKNILVQNIAPGSLKLTIKQREGVDNFEIINGQARIPIKMKVIPAQNIVTAAKPAVGPPKETVDSKEGILNSSIQVKKEPANENVATHNSVVQTSSNIARVKREVRSGPPSPAEESGKAAPALDIPRPIVGLKKEPEPACMVIEINGDDDDDDDDVMFVSTEQVDKKPVISTLVGMTNASPSKLPTTLPSPNLPLPPGQVRITEVASPVSSTASPISQGSNSLSHHQHQPHLSAVPTSRIVTSSVTHSPQISTEKQHNFDWNAPTKDHFGSLDKNDPDTILANLIAGTSSRKDTCGLGDPGPSEYMSMENLGSHVCHQCNIRFTDLALLEHHRMTTGHSNNQLVPVSSGSKAVLPSYNHTSGGMMFPMEQLVETVGKLTKVNNPGMAPYAHQQNITVNIQSFPGGMGNPQAPQQGYQYPGMPRAPGQYPPQYPRMPGQSPTSAFPPGYGQQYPNAYGQFPQAYGQTSGMPTPGYPQQQGYPPTVQFPAQPNAFNAQANSMGMYPPNSQMNAANPMMPQTPDAPGQQSQSPNSLNKQGPPGIRIQGAANTMPGQKLTGPRLGGPILQARGAIRGPVARGATRGRGARPGMRGAVHVAGTAIRGGPRGGMIRQPLKRPGSNGSLNASPAKKRLDMLLPDRHDNEDCHVVSMQQQRDGMKISNIQGSKQEVGVQLSSQITVTKTKVKPPSPPPAAQDGRSVASMLAMRGIKITQKPRSPSPPRINIPNLGAGISITPSKSSSTFSLPEDNQDYACSLCVKTFSNVTALGVHVSQMHPSSSQKMKCDSCPVSYPTMSQLLEHKRGFHNVGPASEMGLPVVDLSQQANLRKLSNLGIVHFIPLANREQAGGCFGIPIVSVQNAMNGAMNTTLQALGANGLLSLGPVKPMPKC